MSQGNTKQSEDGGVEATDRGHKPNPLRLTDRDRHLMGILATVRYLSREQIRRLVFAERNGINLHKRMLALAGEGKHGVEVPYLKKLSYRNREGMPQTAWTLTGLGYTVAESVLVTPPRRPSADTGANFIDHGLLLNELYVQLLEAPLKQSLTAARSRAERDQRPSRSFTRVKAGLYARAAHPAFVWHSHDEVRLPWKQYDMKSGKQFERVIVPDATLEIPGEVVGTDAHGNERQYPGRRYFLEGETGSHTIVAEGDNKPGATLNKLDRYTAFIRDFAGNVVHDDRSTWYTRAYPDGFEPTLLFIVRNGARQQTINRALDAVRRDPHRHQVRAQALTIELAASELLAVLGLGWNSTPAPMPWDERRTEVPRLSPAEFNRLLGFTKAAYKVIQNCRADARDRGAPVPDYPEGVDEMNVLIKRLLGKQ